MGFIGVLHFPHAKTKNIKTISRLCVLPDYQGIGIGHKFLNVVAQLYTLQGYEIKITTSAKNLIAALNKDDKWIMTRYSKNPAPGRNSVVKQTRQRCKTASFFFKR